MKEEHSVSDGGSIFLIDERYYSVAHAASMCSVSTDTIRREIKEGKLPAIKIRTRLRIKDGDLEDWAARSRYKPKGSVTQSVVRPGVLPLDGYKW